MLANYALRSSCALHISLKISHERASSFPEMDSIGLAHFNDVTALFHEYGFLEFSSSLFYALQ